MTNISRYIENRAAEERRRGTPVDISWVKGSDIPDNAIALTTDLGAGKLLLQFFGNEMVFVPELQSSRV